MPFKDKEISPDNEVRLLQLESQLGKVQYQTGAEFPSGFPGFTLLDDKCIVHLSEHLKGEPLACQTAHQLIYAILTKDGYPVSRPADPELEWQKVLSTSVNTLILELKATDLAQVLGFDHNYFFNQRYKEIKNFASIHKGKSLDSFQSRWFALDLALALIFLPADRINFLLSSLRNKEDEAIGLALSIIKLIESIGYNTSGKAFLSMAEIITLIDSWNYCPIYYANQTVTSVQQYHSGFANLRSLLLS